MTRFPISSLAVGLLLSVATTAPAVTFVLDGDAGADYDAVGDGWFFSTPPNQPPDGVGDLGGNDLAVAYETGVVELRAMAEFPLAALSGISAALVDSATLTVTIDDVIGTFGPGTTFDGTAADPIVAFSYPADGVVEVADFSPPGLSELGPIVTGAVTDASLGSTGAVSFDIDVTDAVKDALTNGDDAFGALFATLDTPTATSLDDAAPPGVAGGTLPFLIIETLDTTPPVLGSDALKCQTTLGKEATKLAAAEHKSLTKCLDGVLKDAAKNAGVVGANTAAKCAKFLDPADPNSKLSKAVDKFADKVLSKCGDLPPSAIGSPCDGGAATMADVVACAGALAQESAESLVGSAYGSACILLASVDLAGDFPEVCTP